MSNKRSAYAVLSHYEREYESVYGKRPVINRYRDVWGMNAMVDQFGVESSKQIVSYYFRTQRYGHPLDFLYQNYDKLFKMLELREKDEQRRETLRKQTASLMKRMENNVKH